MESAICRPFSDADRGLRRWDEECLRLLGVASNGEQPAQEEIYGDGDLLEAVPGLSGLRGQAFFWEASGLEARRLPRSLCLPSASFCASSVFSLMLRIRWSVVVCSFRAEHPQ